MNICFIVHCNTIVLYYHSLCKAFFFCKERGMLQYGSISQMLRACAYGTLGIVSDVFNISEVFQCHKSACQGLMSS